MLSRGTQPPLAAPGGTCGTEHWCLDGSQYSLRRVMIIDANASAEKGRVIDIWCEGMSRAIALLWLGAGSPLISASSPQACTSTLDE